MKFHFRLLILLTLCCFKLFGENIATNAFLNPYVAELKATTPPEELEKIKTMAQSELGILHFGYGTYIRNKWLWGNRDPKLLEFFHDNGIDHPDSMSGVIILSLWYDLNRNLTPKERNSIELKRMLVARKRETYETLEYQCEQYLENASHDFEQCYSKYGPPSKNPANKEPFFKLIIDQTGHVQEIIFFEGTSPELKQCLKKIIERFTFDTFSDDKTITIYIVEFPYCRVSERDSLHD